MGPAAFSFNVASVHGSGGLTVERGDKTMTKSASFSRTGGMCPRCEGRGSVSDFDLSALYDDSKSINEGALTIPGYSMDGWYGRIYRGCGYFDPDKPIKKFNKRERHDLLYKEPTKIKVEGINLTYAGLIPQIERSFLSKDSGCDAAARRSVRGAGRDVHHLPRLPRHPAQRGGAVVEDQKESVSPTSPRCRSPTSRSGWQGLDQQSVAPLVEALQETLDSFVEIGLGYLSLDRASGTLSGGEAQRTKMIGHLGSSLTDVTYVFDEPTIGDASARHRADERSAAAAARQGQHRARRRTRARHDRDCRPRRRPRPWRRHRGGEVVFEGTVEGSAATAARSPGSTWTTAPP